MEISEDCIPTWISSLYSFWNRVLGVLAMIDSDETDWKVSTGKECRWGWRWPHHRCHRRCHCRCHRCLSSVWSKGDCDGCWRGQSWRNLHHWGSLDKNSCWLMLGNSYHRKTVISLSLAFSRIWTPKDPDLLILSGASSLCIRFFYFYSFFLQYSLLSSAWKGAFWKRRESVCIQWGV